MGEIQKYSYDIERTYSRKLKKDYWLVKPILGQDGIPPEEFSRLKTAFFALGAKAWVGKLGGFSFHTESAPELPSGAGSPSENTGEPAKSPEENAPVTEGNDEPQRSKKRKPTREETVHSWREIVDEKGSDLSRYTASDLRTAAAYEGLGGLANKDSDFLKSLKPEERSGILDQFYTPDAVVEKMWGLAYKHGLKPAGARVLEPACGTGRFLRYTTDTMQVDAYEPDLYPYLAAKLLHPQVKVVQAKFDSLFFKDGDPRFHLGSDAQKRFNRYDLVIGNPPYRDFKSEFSKKEKEHTGAHTYDQYFMMRGTDLLKRGGFLVFIVPSTFMLNDLKYNGFKEELSQKAELIDAYRLPSNIFPNTSVQTDILVLRKL